MAALAQRFVRISVEPGFAARFRSAGNDAGHEFARSFKMRVQAALAGFNPRVRVQLDLDSFTIPVLPPVNLRVGFDMSQAIQAGRRASQIANAAAGPIILGVQAGGGFGGIGQVFNFVNSGIQQISQQFNNIGSITNQAANSVSTFSSALSGLGGPIGTAMGIAQVMVIIAALPAIIMAAIAAIYALGGALGSIPALSVGAGFSIGALGLGFMGLGQHLKGVAKGGGGAAKSMSAVNNATRSLARAQRELTKATKDLDRARADEIERIDDLGRALRGAVIDEADAVAAVAEARVALAEARATGDPNAIGAAERALNRANLTLEESRDRVGDLAADKAKADKDGVEGSDAMQRAYERQRDAVESVKAAEEALAEARKSAGGGGAAQQLMKLAPAADEVVRKLKQLRPVFEDIRLAVQQALFVGVAGELQKLSDAWKAPLKSTLVSYASTFNGLFKNLGKSVRDPAFIKNITSGAETVRANIDKVGKAITGPLVDAFGRLTKAAKPFIDLLGDKLAGMVENFSAWIKSADESGDLNKFFQDAAYYMGQIWDIGGNLIGVIGDIFGIFFNTRTQGGTRPWLEGLNEQLVMLREWLAAPENQQRIRDFVNRVGELVANGERFTIWVMEQGLPALSQLFDAFEAVATILGNARRRIDEWLERWRRLREAITAPLNFAGMFDGLANAFRSALNRVIHAWNSLSFTVPSISFFGFSSPSFTVDPPYVRPLAKGGVARATPGGITAQIAEGGKDEAVAPVDVLMGYITTAVAAGIGQGVQSGDIVIPIYLFPGAAEMDRVVVDAAERNKGAIAKIANGGNKKLAYGS